MKPPADVERLTPVTRIRGADAQETQELTMMCQAAQDYLRSLKWCKSVVRGYLGIGVGGVVAVFLFQIVPRTKEADEWVWVIVGNLPSAYITVDNARNPACALEGYIYEMLRWVEAAKDNNPVDRLIPVDAEPTAANALELEARLNFLRKHVLKYYAHDLADC